MKQRGQAVLALILSGDIFLNDNQNDEAIRCYLKAADISNTMKWDLNVLVRFYTNLALAYRHKGDIIRAQKLYEYVIASGINDIRFHLSLIELNNGKKNFKKALELAIDCANKFSKEYQAHLILGNCFATLKLYQNAIASYTSAIRINPSLTPAFNNIGVAFKELGEYEKSRLAYAKVLELNPNDSAVHNNLGNLLRNLDDTDGAIRHLKRSIQLNPSYADAYSNLGAVYKENKQYPQAEEFYRHAIALSPDHTNANFDLSLIELSKGEYENGWKRYEHRIKMDELRSKIYRYKTPMWRGENLHGKTIVLQNEQGFGDNIMFIRYVPLFVALGAKVLLRTRPELVKLFITIKGLAKVYSEEDEIPEHDYYLPLLSSPARFKTTLETLPQHFPYLQPDQEINDFECDKKNFSIGLVWSSSRTNKDFKNKYIGLEHFKKLFALKGTRWYSLQAGEDAQEIKTAKLENKITDLSELLVDFSATASIIRHLDLVITTDTAVAHLCGAMDKEAWVLVPTPADWRWMQEGKSTPWYHSLSLFRQHAKGSWNEVISEIHATLLQRIQK